MNPLEQLRASLGERYDVQKEIGAGGMATVFLAQDLKHGRDVAIKVLRPELSATIGTSRFLKEIELAARLQHPHIVPVYDSGSAGELLYYVMPFIDGESLRDRLRRDRRFEIEEAVRLISEAGSALTYAHGHGVVHRDIKPENIMISGGHAVVADFGIARAIDAAAEGTARMTGIGMAIGTPAYMSPEQATASDDVDARSDQYSLACVFYEMVTGEQPFAGSTIQAVISRSITGPRPHLRTVAREAPAGMDPVVIKALSSDPADRYETVESFTSALRSSGAGGGGLRLDWKVGAGIAAMLVLFLLAGWYFGRRPSGPVVAEAERIAVMPFRTTGKSVEYLGEGMVDLLSTNLSTVGGISVVDPRTVMTGWREAGAGAGVGLDEALAIGREADAGAVITGSIISTGSNVRMSADLYGIDGERLAQAQVEGSPDSVLALVDNLSTDLVREVWRSSEPVPNLRLSGVTTESLDALRSYLTGTRFYRRAEWDSASAAFERAVEADSTFALAYYRLALSEGWSGGWQDEEASLATDAAVRFADQLPEKDAALIRAYKLFHDGDPAVLDTLKAYIRKYPSDPEGWFSFADARYHLRPLIPLTTEEVLAPFDSVLALDSTLSGAAIHPLQLTLAEGDSVSFARYLRVLDDAGNNEDIESFKLAGASIWGSNPDSAFRELLNASPGSLVPVVIQARYGLPDPRLDQFDSIISEAISEMPEAERTPYIWGRLGMLISLGRLEKTGEIIESLRSTNPQIAEGASVVPLMIGIAPPDFRPDMQRALEKSQEPNPYASTVRAAYFLVNGQPDRARKAIDQAEIEGSNPGFPGLFRAYRGWATLAEGDTATGLEEIRHGLREAGMLALTWNAAPVRFAYAVVVGSRPETREEGLTLLRNLPIQDMMYMPLAYLEQGRILEAAGDRQGALEAYGQFARLWAGADSALQGRVEEARRAMERLTGEQ